MERKKIFSGSPTIRESATAIKPDGIDESILNIVSDHQGLRHFDIITDDEGLVDKDFCYIP